MVRRLVAQLSATAPLPSIDELTDMVATPGTRLLVAREGGDVVGMLTLITLRLPTGVVSGLPGAGDQRVPLHGGPRLRSALEQLRH
jgi:hypothetical protein